MARTVSYSDQTLSSRNPFTRFAHQSRYRISLAAADDALPLGGTVCDFGAGEGTFLTQLKERRPDAKLIAIEPFMTINDAAITRVAQATELSGGSIDLMTAFETLEHVTDEQLDTFLAETARSLRPSGKLLVTVPIMYGATLPLKEGSRVLLHHKLGDTSPVNIVRATFGKSITRAPNRLNSHRGFDFRWLAERMGAAFKIEQASFSPFPRLPWWLNSQAIFMASAKLRPN